MKAAVMMAGIAFAALPSASSANPQGDAVKTVVAAIAHGEDQHARFTRAIAAKDLPILQRLSACAAHNLMRQKKGDYTLVWACGSKLLGMEVLLTDDRVTSISPMKVSRRPSVEVRRR
jgi:hypothetical protein